MDTQTLLLVGAGLLALLVIALLLVRRRAPVQPTAQPTLEVVPPPADTPSPFVADPVGERDDLRQIKGIGPKLETLLHQLGVFQFAQIAAWTPDQLTLVDAELGSFAGRPERDQWQSQARLLGAGDIQAYERVHGKLGNAAAPDPAA